MSDCHIKAGTMQQGFSDPYFEGTSLFPDIADSPASAEPCEWLATSQRPKVQRREDVFNLFGKASNYQPETPPTPKRLDTEYKIRPDNSINGAVLKGIKYTKPAIQVPERFLPDSDTDTAPETEEEEGAIRNHKDYPITTTQSEVDRLNDQLDKHQRTLAKKNKAINVQQKRLKRRKTRISQLETQLMQKDSLIQALTYNALTVQGTAITQFNYLQYVNNAIWIINHHPQELIRTMPPPRRRMVQMLINGSNLPLAPIISGRTAGRTGQEELDKGRTAASPDEYTTKDVI